MEKEKGLTDIQLYSLPELIRELLNRFDDVVICGKQNKGGDITETWSRHKGVYSSCIGLCDIVKYRILKECEEELKKEAEAQE